MRDPISITHPETGGTAVVERRAFDLTWQAIGWEQTEAATADEPAPKPAKKKAAAKKAAARKPDEGTTTTPKEG